MPSSLRVRPWRHARDSICARMPASSARQPHRTCATGTTPLTSGRAAKSAPKLKASGRGVVEVAHSWLRFRKLLVRYEKLHRSYLALTMLAAAIISFRRVPAKIDIIYDKF